VKPASISMVDEVFRRKLPFEQGGTVLNRANDGQRGMGAMPSDPAIGRASGSPPAQLITTSGWLRVGCRSAVSSCIVGGRRRPSLTLADASLFGGSGTVDCVSRSLMVDVARSG